MLRLLFKATRAGTLPVMLFPVVIGATLAWQQGTAFQAGPFLLTLLGALTAHLGANVINDLSDFASGTDQFAQDYNAEGTTLTTGSQVLLKGTLSPRFYRRLAFGLFGATLLCGLLLSVIRPYTLLFGITGFLLAYFYVAPPLRLAYIGRGLGELDILLSFGILPVLGSYYVQAGTFSVDALMTALPIGLYTVAVLYFHHFLHWRADREAGKITPIVALGEYRGRVVGALLLACISLSLIADVILYVLPWYTIVAILTTVPVLMAVRYARGDLKSYQQLMQAALNANLEMAGLILIGLCIRWFLHI